MEIIHSTPEAEFAMVTYDMLTAQFHDFLPGSWVLIKEKPL